MAALISAGVAFVLILIRGAMRGAPHSTPETPRAIELKPQARRWRILAASILTLAITGALAGWLVPSLQSTERLAQRLVSTKDQVALNSAQRELERRGEKAVPAIIAALHTLSEQERKNARVDDGPPARAALRLLGRIGGHKAIAELRWWLASDSAPRFRANAAAALCDAGDVDSAPAIGAMLKEREGEWRTLVPFLIYCLGETKSPMATVPLIRGALDDTVFADSAAADEYVVPAVVTLAKIDTSEAWALIAEIAAHDNDKYEEDVSRCVAEFGRPWPPPEVSAQNQ